MTDNKEILPELPEWMRSLVPTPRPIQHLEYVDGQYTISGKHFDTFIEAYAWAVFKDLNFTFAETLPEVEHDQQRVYAPATKTDGTSLCFTVTDQQREQILRYQYQMFLELASEWEKDPTDFLKAYGFIDQHPAFWTRDKNQSTWRWNQNGYARQVELFPVPSHNNPPHMWAVEAGEHIAPEYTNHYYNPQLNAYGRTVEEAYITLAALVHKFFHFDGSKRDNALEYTGVLFSLVHKSTDSENYGWME